MKPLEELADFLFTDIVTDIQGRSGLGNEWQQIDSDVMNNELKPAWMKIFQDAIRQAREEMRTEALEKIPHSWLDSLLTGPDAIVGKGFRETQLIERLFNAVRERIKAIKNK